MTLPQCLCQQSTFRVFERLERSDSSNPWVLLSAEILESMTDLHGQILTKAAFVCVHKWGLPRCKNLWTFSLFCTFCLFWFYCCWLLCFLCFTSPVSLTSSYTEDEPTNGYKIIETLKFLLDQRALLSLWILLLSFLSNTDLPVWTQPGRIKRKRFLTVQKCT